VIGTKDIETVIGANAVAADGEKIGKVDTVFLDDATGAPEFALVNTGLFGTRSSFVPLEGAELTEDGDLRVPHSKDVVKDAPNVDADQHLDPAQEAELFRYYAADPEGAPAASAGAEDDPPARRLRPHSR
jgi:hypothetical protein